jgi:L-aminopeptidase/D-esterase
VRDAICSYAVKLGIETPWHLPVVAETHDGWLSNAETFPVTEAMAHAALDSARGGPVAEGNVGGGTGMICHEFKGGIGTSSRVVDSAGEHFTVGALVQANYGSRDLLRVDGVPVGREIPYGRSAERSRGSGGEQLDHRRARHRRPAPADPMPAPGAPRDHGPRLGRGHRGQFQRRYLPRLLHRQSREAKRAPCRCAHACGRPDDAPLPRRAEATEEAILNALTAAETMTGYKGRRPRLCRWIRLKEIMARYRPRP